MQGRCELDEFFAGFVQESAFVVRANNEYARILTFCFFDCRPVFLVDVVPVEIDVVENSRPEGFADNAVVSVGGEPDVPNAPVLFSLFNVFLVAAEGGFERLFVIDAVKGEDIEVVHV